MIAIVKSNFNIEITNLLLQGCIDTLNAKKVAYKVVECPGAVETVGLSKRIIEKLHPDAVIVIGAIIKGDTDHYEYVCQYVTNGHSALSATANVPIVFGILTTQNEELAMERAALDKMNKGKEFAETALYMIDAYSKI
ncbi:MAG: 6,7-dimethyl-8-ribityllumazine synthase [Chitinophagia bacterium]|nr:6,7-dimethyl-8-ribityllumazine synthase [Chitinophagia bacterium]